MKIVVGVQPDSEGDYVVRWAAELARSMRADLVLTAIHPTPWPAHLEGAVDSEWKAFLVEEAAKTLRRATEHIHGVRFDKIVHAHTSSGRGLIEVAEQVGATLIVIGSAAGGAPGRLHRGSTADQLLHGATVPVLLTPSQDLAAAEAAGPGTVPTRVTVAYSRSLDSDEALAAAIQLCRRTGVDLRLTTLVIHPSREFAGFEGALDELRGDARGWLDEALAVVPVATKVSAEIAEGEDLDSAIGAVDWLAGELLVCGSGTAGPLRRVFLGDTAQKILRGAGVPVIVVPRHAEADLDRTRRI